MISSATSASGGQGGARSNVLLALVEWVEKGVAPETVRGVGFVNVSCRVCTVLVVWGLICIGYGGVGSGFRERAL
jgi:hypothetical protein